jgi:hypothetical protein
MTVRMDVGCVLCPYRFRPHLACSVEQALRNARNVNTVYTPLGLILAFYEFLCLRSGTEIVQKVFCSSSPPFLSYLYLSIYIHVTRVCRVLITKSRTILLYTPIHLSPLPTGGFSVDN